MSCDRDSVDRQARSSFAIDVVPGRGAGFSVEGPTGMRFLMRSRMLAEEEAVAFGVVNLP
ncbi:DUF779 domain-containing protein [Microbacterium sp. NPDC016588]